MNQYYIIYPGKPQEGPFAEEILIERYKNGDLPEDTLVWYPGMDNWQSLKHSPLREALEATEMEEFFPKAHPAWSLSLFLLAFLLFFCCLNADDEEAHSALFTCLTPFITLFTFYLSCWFLAKDKKVIKNLFFHTVILVFAEFILWLPFFNSDEVTLPQAILTIINLAVYIIIPYKLYKFSLKHSLWVCGINIAVTFVVALITCAQ